VEETLILEPNDREGTMRQELMSWLRMAAVALCAVAIVGVVVLVGGPALELVALR
jgi:hypothetical protein